MTSSGTFVGIIAADHASRSFEAERNAERQWYENREERLRAQESAGLSMTDRVVAFARREKYKIVGATWIASMVGSFVLVGRNPYISSQQKIVQARVYAQGLTLGVLCASAAFEISDQRRGRGLLDAAKSKESAKREAAEPQPTHHQSQEEGDLWKDMVAAEEQRLKSKHASLYQQHEKEAKEAKASDESDEKKDSDSEEEGKEQDKAQKKEEPKAEKAKSEGAKKA